MMIDTVEVELYSFVPVWIVLIFSRSQVIESENFCANILVHFSLSLNEIYLFSMLLQLVGLLELQYSYFAQSIFKRENPTKVIIQVLLTLACTWMFVNKFVLNLVWW